MPIIMAVKLHKIKIVIYTLYTLFINKCIL